MHRKPMLLLKSGDSALLRCGALLAVHVELYIELEGVLLSERRRRRISVESMDDRDAREEAWCADGESRTLMSSVSESGSGPSGILSYIPVSYGQIAESAHRILL